MNVNLTKILTGAVVALTVIATGCSKSSPKSVALSPDQIPVKMNQVFNQSSGETKDLANNCVSASQNQDAATAFLDLQKLSSRNDLTPEQRATTSRAMAGMFQQLRTASEQGNPAAQNVLHQYLSTR
jgi:hypothetical protein